MEHDDVEMLQSDDNPRTQVDSGSVEVTSNQSKANSQKKEVPLRSEVWNHFEVVTVKGQQKSKCKYCKQPYKYDPSNGTSTLRTHLRRCRKYPPNEAKLADPNQSQITFQVLKKDNEAANIMSLWKFDQKKCRKALTVMIMLDELPFAFVEREGFKYFCQNLQPQFHVPSRRTIVRDCFQLYMEERLKLKNFMKRNCGRVSLTFDTWTSIQNINYLVLTAHFIDNEWNLQKKILNFCPISSHKGDDIGRLVEKCLLAWGIEKVMTVTVDNASSNDVAVVYIKKRVNVWKGGVMNGEFMHIRCVAHIMNLVVKDGLAMASQSVDRVRNAVKYVRQSPARLEKFKLCISDEKIEFNKSLVLDVATRWNSTFLMLDIAQQYQKAFDRYEVKDTNFPGIGESPEDDDWNNVKELVQLLEKFYVLTLRVSGSLYTTSNVYFHEITNVDLLLKNSGAEFETMTTKMREKYDKYWGDPNKLNVLMFIGAVFDPRYKLDFVQFGIDAAYGTTKADILKDKVKNVINSLFLEYSDSSNGKVGSSSKNAKEDVSGNGNQARGTIRAMYKKQKISDESDENKSELEKYYSDPKEDDKDDFDILPWWKKNSLKYPVLSCIARDLLAIPISTVASESAFSTGGRVLDPFRSSLTPKIAEVLICCQDWLRKSQSPICIEERIDEVEKLEKELGSLSLNSQNDCEVIEVI